MIKECIYAYHKPLLVDWLGACGYRKFHADQIFKWLYARREADFNLMTDLSLKLRQLLGEAFHTKAPTVIKATASDDTSTKLLLGLEDNKTIEAVLMPNSRGLHTLCISSQVGCAMGCKFCRTAKMGLLRNLTVDEIVGQMVVAQQLTEQRISNIVFMGMGEPLHNYANLINAMRIIVEGYQLSWRRITLSTSGLVPAIKRLAAEDDVRPHLAVSLNAVDDVTRSEIMPINRRWNIEELLAACRLLPTVGNRKRLTIEYVLLDKITSDLRMARRLVKLLHGLRCSVNLIPFNAWPGSNFETVSIEQAQEFQKVLLDRGILATLRLSKGRNVLAACGQLSTAEAVSIA